MNVNVALDIDGLLVLMPRGLQQAAFFKKKTAIFKIDNDVYCLLPGVSELLQLLHKTSNVSFSFFSAGIDSRNQLFVRALLKFVFPDTHEEILSKIKILSRQHLKPNPADTTAYYEAHGLPVADTPKKDLQVLLGPDDSLENTVLLDDNPQNIAHGQAPNFLYVPETTPHAFDTALAKAALYFLDGLKSLPCFMTTHNQQECSQLSVNRSILVAKREDAFELHFRHLPTGMRRQVALKESQRPQLFAHLAAFYQSKHADLSQKNKKTCHIDNKELQNNLLTYVDGQEGKNLKCCRRINRIFYATGLLFYAMQQAEKTRRPLSACLFECQFQAQPSTQNMSQDSIRYAYFSRYLTKMDEFYWIGLDKLRAINPSLNLIAPREYKRHMDRPLSKESEQALKEELHWETSAEAPKSDMNCGT